MDSKMFDSYILAINEKHCAYSTSLKEAVNMITILILKNLKDNGNNKSN